MSYHGATSDFCTVTNSAPRVKVLNMCRMHSHVVNIHFNFISFLQIFQSTCRNRSSLRNNIQKNANPTPPKLEVTVNQTRSVALLNV